MPTIPLMWLFLVFLAAPSLWLIRRIKPFFKKETRTKVQRGWSLFFAAWALTTTIILIYWPSLIIAHGRLIPIVVAGVAISRITEIVHGFYRDAFDKIEAADPESKKVKKESGTTMRVVERLRWLGVSYAENIFSFAILFFLDQSFFEPCAFARAPEMASLSMSDLLYFSVMTITTTGYGDITPATPGVRMLSGAEALSGVLLLVLVLAAYLSTISGWAAGKEKAPAPTTPPTPN